ncbi:MAG TPA: tryptophan synthase subunit alpha [Polyangiaceae bacterium]|nr:tryptophan synthase subunit alpha [Polyangiaceae bacterium]
MDLEAYIREQRARREILLMTHIVIGYPSLDQNIETVATMVRAGVELIELQIPFSDPMADGPQISYANEQALARRTSVSQCFELAAHLTSSHNIPFLLMTYINIALRGGPEQFVARMRAARIAGAIFPDCPLEEGDELFGLMKRQNISPILIVAPTTSPERMAMLGSRSEGFLYVTARTGVTGHGTRFSEETACYLERCRRATPLPTAVGFGVRGRGDVTFLRGKSDIAILGTSAMEVAKGGGNAVLESFLRELRS